MNDNMRDDERYPTPIHPEREYSDAPEVAPEPFDYHGRDKLPAADPQADTEKIAGDGGPEVATTPPPRTLCGLKKRTFFIVLAVAAVVVIAAVVGGAVGGTVGTNSSSTSSPDADQPSPTSPSTGPQETGPIKAEQRNIAVAGSAGDATQDLQVFYQDLTTTNVLYRRVRDDDGGPEQTLDLDIAPSWGSPLAAAAINGSDPVSVQVFYVAPKEGDNTGALSVVQATLECAGGDDGCATRSNSVISANSTHSVHEDSKLAAVRPDNQTIRVFYQADGGDIWAFNGDDADTDGWSEGNIAPQAYPGSSIVVAASAKTDINLFWVSEESERMRWTRYSDLTGPDGDVEVDSTPGSSWSANVSMTATWVPVLNPYRIYYAQPANGEIVSYFLPEDDSTELNTNHDNSWQTVQGGIAATAWANQVRQFYFHDGDLVIGPQNETEWTAPVSLGG